MSEIIDLDLITPPSVKVRINGKIIEVFPVKVKQLMRLVKIEQELAGVTDQAKAAELILDVLTPLIPQIREDDVDFSLPQLETLMKLVQSNSVPTHLTQTAEEFDPKKKSASPEDSQSSSDTTPDTQSTPSSTNS